MFELKESSLLGGGNAGRFLQRISWEDNAIGNPSQWPDLLMNTVSIVLNSSVPMCFFWDSDARIFFNDDYVSGPGKHLRNPFSLLGSAAKQDSVEWQNLLPSVRQVFISGKSTSLNTGNNSEELCWIPNVSAVRDPHGTIKGVLTIWTERAELSVTLQKLKESKEELEFAIEATRLGTWDYSPATNKFTANNRLKNWFGLSPDEEIELSHAVNAIHERDRARVTAAIAKALDFESGGEYDIEYVVVNPSSHKEILVHAKGRAWFDTNRTAYRFNGTLEDVTVHASAAQKIRESEERLNNLIVSSPFAIGILRGEDLIITTANQAIVDIWGKGWEIMGKSYFVALPELADQGYRQVFSAVYKTGKPFNAVETPVDIVQDGVMQLKYYNFLLYPQRNLDGITEGIGIIATEVTSQALLNKQIKESEKKFRLLADSMPQHIWTSDAVGSLTYFNKSIHDYSGLTPEQILKDGLIQIIHPNDQQQHSEAWMKAVRTGENFLMEHRYRKHDGEYRWQLSRAVAQRDENGEIQSWVGTSTDIQDQKDFSDELERQVNTRTRELAENNSELEKINKELEAFTYISSHDLQEPLRKIQTFTSQLLEREVENLSDKGRDKFHRMQSAAKRMQILIQDLLIYSRSKTSERKFEVTDMNRLVREVKEDLNEEVHQKNARIETSKLCNLRIIPFQFRQLLQNLVSNALKFSKEGRVPTIKIASEFGTGDKFSSPHLQDSVNYCHISVSDNGIGFDPQYSEKIFEVFQRLNEKKESQGTGIGLAIVKKIVENHHGVVTASGRPNEGATFDIYIPAD